MGVPYFSIVVPVFNRESFIGVLIDSVLRQQFRDFELVIVNDGSTDGSESKIMEYRDPRIRYLRIENSERGRARNVGANVARGRYFNFFDSDDVMLENHLSAAHQFIKESDSPEWFHVGFEICDEQGSVLVRETGVKECPEGKLIVTNYLGCDSVFVERTFFLNNRFSEDPRMASAEDWHLWLRLIARKPLWAIPEITLRMTHHSNRSLLTISADRTVERDTLMLQSLLEDELFTEKFSEELPIFEADRYTFFALAMAVEKRRAIAIRYLAHALRVTSSVLGRRRFWASLKIILMP